MSVQVGPVSTATGTATGIGSGTAISGNTVRIGGQSLIKSDLSALISVTANSSGLTFTPRWQVSANGSTWYTLKQPENPSVLALATGASGGGDVAGVAVISAPSAVKGWQYARAQVVVGAATGTTNDTYSIGYAYRQHRIGAQR